jgi:hypothetical protein
LSSSANLVSLLVHAVKAAAEPAITRASATFFFTAGMEQ